MPGLWGVVTGVAITGFLSAGSFAMAIRTKSFRWSMAAAYMLYLAVFGLYTNLWTQEVDWLLVVPLLLILGAVAEDPAAPPGLTGRAWARINSMRGARQADPPTTPAKDEPPSSRADRRLAKNLLLVGLGVVAVMVASAITIQRLLPEPYPLLESASLPESASTAAAVMTDSNVPEDNLSVQWVNLGAGFVKLSSYLPDASRAGATLMARIPIPKLTPQTAFDIGYWPPWREPALFSFNQQPNRLSIRVSPTNRSEGKPEVFQAPISPPGVEAVNSEMVATWGGTKPDLFIVTRGSAVARAQIRVLSGESGFHKQLFVSPLPFRGLAPDRWAMDVGQIATLPKEDAQRAVIGDRPDLLLIHHNPNKKHSDVQVLIGESGFQWDAFQRDLNTPGSVPPGTDFLIGSQLGGTAIYEVRPRRAPRSHAAHRSHGEHRSHGARRSNLRVFGLETPPGFK